MDAAPGSAISAGPVTASTRWKALSLSAVAAAEQVAAVMGNSTSALPPAAESGHSTQDKAEAQRKAAQQAQALLAAAQCKSGNAYLSAKGWPEVDPDLTGPAAARRRYHFPARRPLLPLHNAGARWSTCS